MLWKEKVSLSWLSVFLLVWERGLGWCTQQGWGLGAQLRVLSNALLPVWLIIKRLRDVMVIHGMPVLHGRREGRKEGGRERLWT